MSEEIKGRTVVTVRSRAALRDWLAADHAAAGGRVARDLQEAPSDHLPWLEAIEELICFGWIDAVTQRVDVDRSAHLVAPRKPGSAWSALNKQIVARMRAEGRMTQAGEAAIAVAEANGMWVFLDDVERLEMPGDLRVALGGLAEVWEGWPRSVKRGTLEWIKTAKTAPTRAKRISDVVSNAEQGRRPSPFQR
jgi:uncharacterized protein YdeI (YjbR/CyaY-like superfamily)